MTAQIVHAAGESITSPLPPNTNAVVLCVETEPKLLEVAKALALSEIAHVVIREVDVPFDGQTTAIGVVPIEDRTKVKKILSGLPLLGEDNYAGASEGRFASKLKANPAPCTCPTEEPLE